jgi:hypothetical protein
VGIRLGSGAGPAREAALAAALRSDEGALDRRKDLAAAAAISAAGAVFCSVVAGRGKRGERDANKPYHRDGLMGLGRRRWRSPTINWAGLFCSFWGGGEFFLKKG